MPSTCAQELQRQVQTLQSASEGRGEAGGSTEPPRLREEGQQQLAHMDELLKQPTMERHIPDVNAAVERYVANKRAKQVPSSHDCLSSHTFTPLASFRFPLHFYMSPPTQDTINEYLDLIEDYLSPSAPLQVAFDPTDGLARASTSSSPVRGAPCGTTMLSNTPRSGTGESILGMGKLGNIKSEPHALKTESIAGHPSAPTPASTQPKSAPPAQTASPVLTTAKGSTVPHHTKATTNPPPTAALPPKTLPAGGAKSTGVVPLSSVSKVAEGTGAGAVAGEKRASSDSENGDGEKRQRRETVGSQLMGKLSMELGLTGPQVDALSAQKEFIRSDRELVHSCVKLIRDLRQKVAEHVKTSQGITDGLRRILTPVQVAKFLVWVERNQKSMDLLNSMLTDA